MRQRNKRLLPAILTTLACTATALYAQLESTGTVIRADVRLVVLHTTVVDKTGHLVMDLNQKAFTVYENGVAQEIRHFKREDVPVSMGLIVDNSGSMREKRARVEAAALALVKDSNPEDEGFVVNFNDEAFLDLPPGEEFTNDAKHMEEALTRIDARGGTALFDAIRMSIDHVKKKGHKDKRVLVVVTDGNDNQSVISLESLVKLAQQSEVLIYAVGLLGEEGDVAEDGGFEGEEVAVGGELAAIGQADAQALVLVSQTQFGIEHLAGQKVAFDGGKGLPVVHSIGRCTIQLVASADVLVVHGDFIVMRQRAAGVVIRRLCQGQRQAGESFPKRRHWVVFLGVPAGDEFAGPLRRCLLFRSLPQARVEREGVGGEVKRRQ